MNYDAWIFNNPDDEEEENEASRLHKESVDEFMFDQDYNKEEYN